jgi:hypothetical protein
MSYFSFLDSKSASTFSTKNLNSKLDNLRLVNLINQYELILKNIDTVKGTLQTEKDHLQQVGENLLKMSELITSLVNESLTTIDSSVNNIRFQLEKYKENIDTIVEGSYYLNIKTLRNDVDLITTFDNVNNSNDISKNKIQVTFYRADTKNLGGKKISFDNTTGVLKFNSVPLQITDIDYDTASISIISDKFSDFSGLRLLLEGDYVSLGNSNNQYRVNSIGPTGFQLNIDNRLINGITFGIERYSGVTNSSNIYKYSYVGEVDWGKSMPESDNDNYIDRNNAQDHLSTVANGIQQVGNYIRDVDTNLQIVKSRESVFVNLKNQLLETLNK